MVSPPHLASLPAVLGLAVFLLSWLASGGKVALAEEKERWHAPFGGYFNASFTVTTDYSFAGISQTKLGPAVQVGLDYRTKEFSPDLPVWFYATAWGSNFDYPIGGPGIEVDLAAGLKTRILDRKLSIDVGYIRYTFLGPPADLHFNYGDISLNVSYDFGFASLAGRLRVSPNSFGNSGQSWNKRGLLTVPLPFIRINDDISFKIYGALGNINVERFLDYGVPSREYWYWQTALVTSAYGFDVMVAYTDTSIARAGCGYTGYCAGRVFTSITKAF